MVSAFENVRVGPAFALSSRGDLIARTGRVTLIRGESGSGKSVLLQMLAGYRGRGRSAGGVHAFVALGPEGAPIPLAAFRAEPTRLSYLSQLSVLRPELTPAQALRDWCELLTAAYPPDHPVARFVAQVRRDGMAALFSPEEQTLFDSAARVRIRELSGGQKRRLDVLLTLCSPAELLLLDEPDTGLDAARRRVLFQVLIAHAAAHARIIGVVSHYAAEEAPPSGAIDTWLTRRCPNGSGAVFSMPPQPPAAPVRLQPHEPPPERGNRRLDQYLLYLRQRMSMMRRGRTAAFLAVSPALMALMRLAVYPSPVADGPSMALLFFYVIACFWLGTVQSTGFWTEEQTWFQRECRHGASTAAYLLAFLTAVGLLVAAAAGLGGLVVKFLSWADVLTGNLAGLGSDLHVGPIAICWWGVWAGCNGSVCGLFAATLQHARRPAVTSPATAQLVALALTLTAIVFSYPMIGSRAYQEIVEDPASPNRLAIWGEAIRQAGRRELPVAAIVAAECPLGTTPSFHGLWFQGERPLRYGMTGRALGNARKQAVPPALLNFALLAGLVAVSMRIAWGVKNAPTAT